MTYWQEPRSKNRTWSPGWVARFEKLEELASRKRLSDYQLAELQGFALYPDDDYRERAVRLLRAQEFDRQEGDETMTAQELYERAAQRRRNGIL